MIVTLIRDQKGKKVTFGNLEIWNILEGARASKTLFTCNTLEELWRDNQRDNPNTPEAEESCIPPGDYFLRRRASSKFGVTPYVIGTQPARDYILIHKANTVEDILGCIAVGKERGTLKSRHTVEMLEAVIKSGVAFDEMMKILESSDEWKSGKDIPFKVVGQGTII